MAQVGRYKKVPVFYRLRFFEEHPEEYQRIVDRNYDLLVKKHTWKERYYAIQKEFVLLKNKI